MSGFLFWVILQWNNIDALMQNYKGYQTSNKYFSFKLEYQFMLIFLN